MTSLQGEKNPRAILNDKQVSEIKEFIRLRKTLCNKTLARKYGISYRTMKEISAGHSWKHIK
jgi:hypothetical protein